jgi:hypothetical protein
MTKGDIKRACREGQPESIPLDKTRGICCFPRQTQAIKTQVKAKHPAGGQLAQLSRDYAGTAAYFQDSPGIAQTGETRP